MPPDDEAALRAAYEEQIRALRVEHVLLDSVVTMVNLGMRRSGLMPGTEAERDPEQLQLAIEAVRAHLPLLDRAAPEQVGAIRDALAQLQLAYVQIGGSVAPEAAVNAESPGPSNASASAPASAPASSTSGPGAPEGEGPGAEEASEPIKPGEPGPAQRSGRLWVPGQ